MLQPHLGSFWRSPFHSSLGSINILLVLNVFHQVCGQQVFEQMVRLTMTKAMVVALQLYKSESKECLIDRVADEPSLDEPAVGNPISHGQVIQLSNYFRHRSKSQESTSTGSRDDAIAFDLDNLLRGSKVYVEPPKPKPEPVRSPPADLIFS